MYKLYYEESTVDEKSRHRESEREAIEHSITILLDASKSARGSMKRVEALAFTNRLWSFFLEGLCQEESPVPAELRAKMISIGIWILKEVDAIGDDRSENFKGLIEIQQIIAEGLR